MARFKCSRLPLSFSRGLLWLVPHWRNHGKSLLPIFGLAPNQAEFGVNVIGNAENILQLNLGVRAIGSRGGYAPENHPAIGNCRFNLAGQFSIECGDLVEFRKAGLGDINTVAAEDMVMIFLEQIDEIDLPLFGVEFGRLPDTCVLEQDPGVALNLKDNGSFRYRAAIQANTEPAMLNVITVIGKKGKAPALLVKPILEIAELLLFLCILSESPLEGDIEVLANSVGARQVIEQQPIEIELFLMGIAELGAQERFEVVLQFLVIDPQHGKENQTILSFDKDLLKAGVLF